MSIMKMESGSICPDSRCPNIVNPGQKVEKKGTKEFGSNAMTLAQLRCARVSALKKKTAIVWSLFAAICR